MAEDRDRRTVIAGLRTVRDWFNTPPLKQYLVSETFPGPDVESDDELLAYAREMGSTVFTQRAPAKWVMTLSPLSTMTESPRYGGTSRDRCLRHAGGDVD